MKKIICFWVLLCMLLALSSCFSESPSQADFTSQQEIQQDGKQDGQEDSKQESTTIPELAKFNVVINVNFTENLIMNKYDADFYIGESKIGILKHGVGESFNVELNEGKNEFTFTKSEEKSICGKAQIFVDKNLELIIDILGRSSSIDVEIKSVSEIRQLSESEAKLPLSSAECNAKDYEEVELAFRNAGFSDITVTPIYDIIFGVTKEKSLKSITVNGNDSFSKWDITDKSSKIEIVYHMKTDNDPSLISIPLSSTECRQKDYKDVEAAFKDAGFSNIVLEPQATDNFAFTDCAVYEVSINGNSFFGTDKRQKDNAIIIKYYQHIEVPTDFDLAFVKKNKEYSTFYAFDFEFNRVIYFVTSESYIMDGSYTGSFSTGIIIDWTKYSDGWFEKFIYHQNAVKGTLIDHDNFEWGFDKCDPRTAQIALNTLIQNE